MFGGQVVVGFATVKEKAASGSPWSTPMVAVCLMTSPVLSLHLWFCLAYSHVRIHGAILGACLCVALAIADLLMEPCAFLMSIETSARLWFDRRMVWMILCMISAPLLIPMAYWCGFNTCFAVDFAM